MVVARTLHPARGPQAAKPFLPMRLLERLRRD